MHNLIQTYFEFENKCKRALNIIAVCLLFCSVVSDSLGPHDPHEPTRLLCHGIFQARILFGLPFPILRIT